MRVIFKLEESKLPDSKLFEILKKELVEYCEFVNYEFVSCYSDDRETYVVHSTGNQWKVFRTDTVYLEYDGSRMGFYAMTPWGNVLLEPVDDGVKIFIDISLLGEKEEGEILEKYGEIVHIDNKVYAKIAYMRLHEYHTSTPSEWKVKYYHIVLPLEGEKDKAVIIDPFHGPAPLGISILKVVPYKNVYR